MADLAKPREGQPSWPAFLEPGFLPLYLAGALWAALVPGDHATVLLQLADLAWLGVFALFFWRNLF